MGHIIREIDDDTTVELKDEIYKIFRLLGIQHILKTGDIVEFTSDNETGYFTGIKIN